jgi:hypothetical protein
MDIERKQSGYSTTIDDNRFRAFCQHALGLKRFQWIDWL